MALYTLHCRPGLGGASLRTRTHLPREVTFPVKVHVLVLLAVHAQAKLERLPVGVEAELQFTQAVEELGQVAAHLGWAGGSLDFAAKGFKGRRHAAWVFLGGF